MTAANNKELIANYSGRMESSTTWFRFRFIDWNLCPFHSLEIK